jgi:hypothetical protein
MIVSDRTGLVERLRNSGRNITIQEGGRWGAENRSAAVQSVVGMVQARFEENTAPDPAKVQWVTKLQNLLTSSKTEQSAYDFKQGFLTLSERPSFDENSFQKILETCVAIANISPKHKGYVIVGVAENAATALRVEKVLGASNTPFSGYFITGVEHEAGYLRKNLDQLFQDITDKVRASGISEPLKSHINSRLKSVRYYDKTVFVFEISGQKQPSLFNEVYFERQGTQTLEVKPDGFPALFARFR